jgi:hypothetical protein
MSELYWCPKCGMADAVELWKLLPVRETTPNYQYRFISVPTCNEGHRMMPLCISCLNAPALEGFDECRACLPEEEWPEVKRDQTSPVKVLLRDEIDEQMRDGFKTLYRSKK